MNERENLHSGHRERMTEKLINSPDSLSEHELLEVLLYSFIPRKDTNEISHRLLRTFGSIENLLNADPKDIAVVDGIGKTTASRLVLCGKILDNIEKQKSKKSNRPMRSFFDNKEEFINFFKGLKHEKFVIYLLDKRFYKITTIEFSNQDRIAVSGDIPEIAKIVALNKPTYALLAHNHPSGNKLPSDKDDEATAKLNLTFSLHGVTLIDHVIATKDDAYSYHLSGRLDYIKKNYVLNSKTPFKENE